MRRGLKVAEITYRQQWNDDAQHGQLAALMLNNGYD